MPDFKEVLSQHKDAFQGQDGIDEQFSSIATKLGELGYDVLINHREKAEFVPSGRLNEVVSQREQFKEQVTTLNTQLEELKQKASGNDALQVQIQNLMNANKDLLSGMEKTKIETEVMLKAKEANDPKDVLAFVDMTKLSVNDKSEVVGVEKEVERIKKEKPYLFSPGQRKAGFDDGGTGGGQGGFNMNNLIRRAAGR